jgi:hypothetical protein
MNEPRRLLESGSPALRALVLAGKRDAPGRRTEAAVLGALGLGGAGGAAVGAAHAAQAGARSSVARLVAGLKQAAFSKIGIGVIAAATAGGSGYVFGRGDERAAIDAGPRASQGEHRTLTRPARGEALTTRAIPVVAAPATASPSAATPSPSTSARLGRAAPAADGTEHAPTPAPPSLVEQLASIRRARAMVESGDGDGAIRELEAYAARTPHGDFEEEALALRVRALRLGGDASGAARELANLRSRFPASVHIAALTR